MLRNKAILKNDATMKELIKEFLKVKIEEAPAWQFLVGMIAAWIIGIITGIVLIT